MNEIHVYKHCNKIQLDPYFRNVNFVRVCSLVDRYFNVDIVK